MKRLMLDHIDGHAKILETLRSDEQLLDSVYRAAAATAQSMQNGGKLLIAGNGGSAADAQHLAAEFVGRLTIDRPSMFAIALTTDTSILTAVGNDYGYEHTFDRQIEGLGRKGDVFMGISTSGNSPNILQALAIAKRLGLVTIGLAGKDGGAMAHACDYPVVIRTNVTAHVQEMHLMLEHMYCAMVERCYFGLQMFGES